MGSESSKRQSSNNSIDIQTTSKERSGRSSPYKHTKKIDTTQNEETATSSQGKNSVILDKHQHMGSTSESSLYICSPLLVMPNCRSLPTQNEGAPLGLWNLGNTCYANSVIQALYQCQPFRQGCIEELSNNSNDGLLNALAQLFTQMSRYKRLRKTGYVNPAKFIEKLRERTEIFRTPEHHDAHEFYSFLLNEIGDELCNKKETVSTPYSSPFRNVFRRHFLGGESTPNTTTFGTSALCTPEIDNNEAKKEKGQQASWIHELFQGCFSYEIRCLCCENVSQRQEPFFDVPVDVQTEQTELTLTLLNFAKTEFLCGKNKYVCNLCCCLQEAERKLKFLKLPRILTIHLKRFNFNELSGNYYRAGHRVEFPVVFSFPNSAISQSSYFFNTDVIYNLFAVVVHIGTSMTHGHYIVCVRWNKGWWVADDHNVKPTAETALETFFGSARDNNVLDNGVRCGYLLFYEMSQRFTEESNQHQFGNRCKKTDVNN